MSRSGSIRTGAAFSITAPRNPNSRMCVMTNTFFAFETVLDRMALGFFLAAAVGVAAALVGVAI